MPLRVRLTSGLGHAFFAATTCALPEAEQNASGARGRLLVPVGNKILLTSAIRTASTCQNCQPERNVDCQKLKRCACSSLLHSSFPERKVMNAPRFARPARQTATFCHRSGTRNPRDLTLPRALEEGTGSYQNLSGARAFGCSRNYSGTKFRVPALRGLTLLVNGPQRCAASGPRGRLCAEGLAGRLTHAVVGPFDQPVRPRLRRHECPAAGRR